MRRGELLGLTWRAVDLDGARLSVEQQALPTPGGVTFGPPKSSRSRRTIALDPATVAALRTHRACSSSNATSPVTPTSTTTSCLLIRSWRRSTR
jgi:integrase